MSEKTKTPREMAEEIIRAFFKGQEFQDKHDAIAAEEIAMYIAMEALEAGAKMGYEARHRLGYGPDSKVNWDSFNEWWASLEGEK